MRSLYAVTITPDLESKRAILGIEAVHRARVAHNDPYPKNLLIVPGMTSNGTDDRVVWIDFDIAFNFGSMRVGGRLQYDESIEAANEKSLVESYGMMLVIIAFIFFVYLLTSIEEDDQKQSLPKNTKFY
ncbi:hypothetical protein AJ78_04363 [Emergomyces pasteurianus Ep9510]|uniref:Protein kinase domain-containing protein n=1 Tax=Emergomyces pasteurianus Ep9510 TaxID=1447872 RepID=A0A1J9PG54_9EURO|nr:hypothetical protein AJ78_04363 [Emergomyces pasteurianus Ep9510]